MAKEKKLDDIKLTQKVKVQLDVEVQDDKSAEEKIKSKLERLGKLDYYRKAVLGRRATGEFGGSGAFEKQQLPPDPMKVRVGTNEYILQKNQREYYSKPLLKNISNIAKFPGKTKSEEAAFETLRQLGPKIAGTTIEGSEVKSFQKALSYLHYSATSKLAKGGISTQLQRVLAGRTKNIEEAAWNAERLSLAEQSEPKEVGVGKKRGRATKVAHQDLSKMAPVTEAAKIASAWAQADKDAEKLIGTAKKATSDHVQKVVEAEKKTIEKVKKELVKNTAKAKSSKKVVAVAEGVGIQQLMTLTTKEDNAVEQAIDKYGAQTAQNLVTRLVKRKKNVVEVVKKQIQQSFAFDKTVAQGKDAPIAVPTGITSQIQSDIVGQKEEQQVFDFLAKAKGTEGQRRYRKALEAAVRAPRPPKPPKPPKGKKTAEEEPTPEEIQKDKLKKLKESRLAQELETPRAVKILFPTFVQASQNLLRTMGAGVGLVFNRLFRSMMGSISSIVHSIMSEIGNALKDAGTFARSLANVAFPLYLRGGEFKNAFHGVASELGLANIQSVILAKDALDMASGYTRAAGTAKGLGDYLNAVSRIHERTGEDLRIIDDMIMEQVNLFRGQLNPEAAKFADILNTVLTITDASVPEMQKITAWLQPAFANSKESAIKKETGMLALAGTLAQRGTKLPIMLRGVEGLLTGLEEPTGKKLGLMAQGGANVYEGVAGWDAAFKKAGSTLKGLYNQQAQIGKLFATGRISLDEHDKLNAAIEDKIVKQETALKNIFDYYRKSGLELKGTLATIGEFRKFGQEAMGNESLQGQLKAGGFIQGSGKAAVWQVFQAFDQANKMVPIIEKYTEKIKALQDQINQLTSAHFEETIKKQTDALVKYISMFTLEPLKFSVYEGLSKALVQPILDLTNQNSPLFKSLAKVSDLLFAAGQEYIVPAFSNLASIVSTSFDEALTPSERQTKLSGLTEALVQNITNAMDVLTYLGKQLFEPLGTILGNGLLVAIQSIANSSLVGAIAEQIGAMFSQAIEQTYSNTQGWFPRLMMRTLVPNISKIEAMQKAVEHGRNAGFSEDQIAKDLESQGLVLDENGKVHSKVFTPITDSYLKKGIKHLTTADILKLGKDARGSSLVTNLMKAERERSTMQDELDQMWKEQDKGFEPRKRSNNTIGESGTAQVLNALNTIKDEESKAVTKFGSTVVDGIKGTVENVDKLTGKVALLNSQVKTTRNDIHRIDANTGR